MPNSQKVLKADPLRVLGIDPGYERLGIAVVEKQGEKNTLLHSECFKTLKTENFSSRLFRLGERIKKVITEWKPDVLAIENLFIEKNQKTAMRVSEVRGAIIYLCTARGLSIHEYTPLQIKIAVTGYGKSEKQQVESMVRRLIHLKKKKIHDDEIDAIAIALTGSASIR